MPSGTSSVPSVAVITRTMNRPILLRRTMESLLAQTFTDWQWVVVTIDPADPVDPVVAAGADRLAGRVQVLPFVAEVPGMRGAPLNHAIRNSSSRFITVLDDDDTWEPGFLERMVAALDSGLGALAGGAVCRTQVIEESGIAGGLQVERTYVLNPKLRSLTLAQLAVVNQFCIHAFVYRREALAACGLYPEDFPVLEDWHFNLRFLAHHDVMVVPEQLTNYHQRPNVVSGSDANSFFAEIDAHKFYESKLINGLLREDLATGRTGLGTLLAAAAQNRLLQDRLHILEGKVRRISEKVGKIDARTTAIKAALTDT